MRSDGMTLLEILVVIAVIGILLGLIGMSFVRSIRTAELREAATQVVTDLRRARATSQRESQNMTLQFPTSSNTNKTSYTVTRGTGTAAIRSLDKGVTIACRPAPTGGGCGTGNTISVVYQAPYGELGAVGSVLELRSPLTGVMPLEVRIVGVTGKVILTQGTP